MPANRRTVREFRNRLFGKWVYTLSEHGYTDLEWECRVENGSLWFEDCLQTSVEYEDFSDMLDYCKTLNIVSLGTGIIMRQSFGDGIKVDAPLDVTMQLRAEKRGQLIHWYAYKNCAGKLRKIYAGHSEQINTARIVLIAKKFSGWR